MLKGIKRQTDGRILLYNRWLLNGQMNLHRKFKQSIFDNNQENEILKSIAFLGTTDRQTDKIIIE